MSPAAVLRLLIGLGLAAVLGWACMRLVRGALWLHAGLLQTTTNKAAADGGAARAPDENDVARLPVPEPSADSGGSSGSPVALVADEQTHPRNASVQAWNRPKWTHSWRASEGGYKYNGGHPHPGLWLGPCGVLQDPTSGTPESVRLRLRSRALRRLGNFRASIEHTWGNYTLEVCADEKRGRLLALMLGVDRGADSVGTDARQRAQDGRLAMVEPGQLPIMVMYGFADFPQAPGITGPNILTEASYLPWMPL
jgi:hypothetical protein